MPVSVASPLPADVAQPTGFLQTLLTTALVAVAVLQPLYEDDAETIRDFAWVYLNPAGQLLLHQPECPLASLLTLFPTAPADGVFDKCCQAFQTGAMQRNQTYYQADGLDGYFLLVAQRYENVLVVNFTDTNNWPHSAAEEALRTSQVREQHVQAQLRQAQAELTRTLHELPVAVAVYEGPTHVLAFYNDIHEHLAGRPLALGQPATALFPDLVGQPLFQIPDQVYATGKPLVLAETPVSLRQPDTGELVTHYFTVRYEPRRDPQGQVTGLLVTAVPVTEQVQARKQVQALNEELTTTNAEYQASNTALADAQRQLLHLNQELEARVQERTAQLAEQQDLLGQLLSQLPAFVATLSGPEHRFTFANALYQQLVAGRATLGMPVAEALPEVVEQGFIQLLDRVYASGQPYLGREIAILLQSPGAEARQHYLDFTYQPLSTKPGQVQSILVFAVDVTEQVRTRRQANTLQTAMLAAVQRQAAQRQELQQVFEQAPAAVVLLREPNHRIEYVNPAYARFFPGQTLPGRLMTEMHPALATSGALARLDRVYETGEPYVGEAQPVELALTPGQPPQTRYFNFTYQPYREDGRIVGVSIFAYDVTEQTLARQQQAQQEQRLQRLFEQAPVAIFVLRGPDYVLEVVNAAMSEVLGRPAATVLGQPYFEAIPELATQGYPELLAQVWQTGEPVVVQESPAQLARHQAGETGYFTFVYQPLIDADNTLTGIMCVAVEVTGQVVARRQVQQLNDELRASNRALQDTNDQLTRTNVDLDTFVYTASHDLKSPIANIEGLLVALRRHLPAGAMEGVVVPRLLGLMDGAVSRFQQTLGHLTEVSRIHQELSPSTEAVDVAALVESVRLDILPELMAADATLTVDVAACPTVQAPAKSLRSVIYNLLSNALKYRDPDRVPVVQLRAYRTPGHAVLEVQDNGLGLSEAQQQELFRLFRRLHTHVGGSGVGLYTIKRLVENAGGTITVASQPGVGSTFKVSLPVR